MRYTRNPVRLRSRANYRQGLELASSEFIKFLNDDDMLAPACVERLVAAFMRAPDVALATSRRRRIDEHDNLLPDQPATLPIVERDSLIAGASLANAMLMAGLNIVGEPSTVLFRKSDLLDQAPAYFRFHGEDGRGVIDMTMWSALLLKGDTVYLRDSLSSFRIHDAQQQHEAATVQRSIGGIRGLQAAWLALDPCRRCPPDRLLTKPYPFDASADWMQEPVLSFSSPAAPGMRWHRARRPCRRRPSSPTDRNFNRTTWSGRVARGGAGFASWGLTKRSLGGPVVGQR